MHEADPANPPAGSAASLRLGMESISDVVFGLALSIGSIVFIARYPQTIADLLAAIFQFGFSFLIVFMVWLSYRRSIVALRYETQGTVVVNVALLFSVSIEPFLLYVLFSPSSIPDATSTAYAIDVGVIMLLLSTLNYLLLAEERRDPTRKVPPQVIDRTRRSTWVRAGIGLFFLLSALPVFWVPAPIGGWARIDMWILSLASAFLVPDLGAGRWRRRKDPRTSPTS